MFKISSLVIGHLLYGLPPHKRHDKQNSVAYFQFAAGSIDVRFHSRRADTQYGCYARRILSLNKQRYNLHLPR
jgi:hypothetical protein